MMSHVITAVMSLLLGLWSLPCQAQLSFTFSRDTIDMGTVGPCETVLDSFDMVNTGSEIFAAPDSSSLSGFIVTTDDVSNVLPGQRRRYYVRFNGTTARPIYRTLHIISLTINGQTATDTVLLIGRRAPGRCCVFMIDSMAARAGDDVGIDIRQDSTPPLADLSFVTMTMQIGFEPSVLVPDGPMPGELSRTQNTITVRVPLRANDGPIVTLPFRAALGRVVTSPVEIIWYSLSASGLGETSYSGSFTVLDVCDDGGRVRGFEPEAGSPVVVMSKDGYVEVSSTSLRDVAIDVFSIGGVMVASGTCHANGSVRFGPLHRGLHVLRIGHGSRPTFLVVN